MNKMGGKDNKDEDDQQDVVFKSKAEMHSAHLMCILDIICNINIFNTK